MHIYGQAKRKVWKGLTAFTQKNTHMEQVFSQKLQTDMVTVFDIQMTPR